MHLNWKHIAIALAVLPFAAILVAWIGFFNVGASSGHWKITDWFLHFAMRSAVRTYALVVDVPEELPRHAIQPAAGHFARGCAICHGAPGEPRPAAVLKMLPQPPDLAGKVDEWSDAQLFRIVKHGIRFTGMPAWPTQQRDDEVWSMVAFLRELPRMEKETYRELAYGKSMPAARPRGFESALAECARCHGEGGLGRSSVTPIIADRNESYLLESLRAYADGRRPSGIMSEVATAIDRAEWGPLARHFASIPSTAGASPASDLDLRTVGETIAINGVASRNVPACLGCHDRPGSNPLYPALAGQRREYIGTQLKLFREGVRGGTAFSHLMVRAANNLTDQDIAALATYFSSSQPLSATTRR
jgi:cytochrome c553